MQQTVITFRKHTTHAIMHAMANVAPLSVMKSSNLPWQAYRFPKHSKNN